MFHKIAASETGFARNAASIQLRRSVNAVESAMPMVDVFTTRQRSKIMSCIRGTDTAPERTVRAFLRKSGFHLRSHAAYLPGKPDILVPECRAAVFVNGCFWHGHAGCKRAALPTTRAAFWRSKIAGNVRRDRRNNKALQKMGWHVVTVWQCQLTATKIRGRFKSLLTRLTTLAGTPRHP
jgi:DNA mismatch endonuclease, patch repair protein